MPYNYTDGYTSPSFEGNATSLKSYFTSDTMERTLRANGLYTEAYLADRWYSAFKRFGCVCPQISITGAKEYLFFTKPDLHLFEPGSLVLNDELSNVNFFREAAKRYVHEMKQLQFSVSRGGALTTTNGWDSQCDTVSPFMNLLGNCVSNSLELPAITASVNETSATINGNKSFYRKTSIQSDHDFEFGLEFEDCRDLSVYMLFKIYDQYERLKTEGRVSPPDEGYILQKILHDQFSIYKFIVDNDGSTILYYAKLTGVFPLGVPRDSFSDMNTNTNGLKFTVSFKATYIEDMNPIILAEFNDLTKNVSPNNDELPIYDNEISAVSGEWATAPYITRDKNPALGQSRIYHLRWRR